MVGDSETVFAFHCSGAGPAQWRGLSDRLGAAYQVVAPAQYGAAGGPVWPGLRAFTLADEAAPVLRAVDKAPGPVHLVGHSYGGGLALHIALARPNRVASLGLYEPSAFHLLKAVGAAGVAPYAEIAAVTRAVTGRLAVGDREGAMRVFIDYWSGEGSWEAMKPEKRVALRLWSDKAALDFHALLEEPFRPDRLAACAVPTLILRGSAAPAPTATIATHLSRMLPVAETGLVEGAGHMGPFTHREIVEDRLATHVRRCVAAGRRASAWRPAA